MLAKGSMHKSVYSMLQGVRRKEKLERMRLWEDTLEKDSVTSSES
jgi:hypothetical protein